VRAGYRIANRRAGRAKASRGGLALDGSALVSLPGEGIHASIASDADHKQGAMLRILLATCETTLDALQGADNSVDQEFVGDLERVIAHTPGSN
jgi:hypothetical protein